MLNIYYSQMTLSEKLELMQEQTLRRRKPLMGNHLALRAPDGLPLVDMITKEPQVTNITSRRSFRTTTSLVKDRRLQIALLLAEMMPIQMLNAGEKITRDIMSK